MQKTDPQNLILNPIQLFHNHDPAEIEVIRFQAFAFYIRHGSAPSTFLSPCPPRPPSNSIHAPIRYNLSIPPLSRHRLRHKNRLDPLAYPDTPRARDTRLNSSATAFRHLVQHASPAVDSLIPELDRNHARYGLPTNPIREYNPDARSAVDTTRRCGKIGVGCAL